MVSLSEMRCTKIVALHFVAGTKKMPDQLRCTEKHLFAFFVYSPGRPQKQDQAW